MEDFGITPVEVMAAGRPVIARAAGGALETVLPGETGILVDSLDLCEKLKASMHGAPSAQPRSPW